jgi:hypothetical protein
VGCIYSISRGGGFVFVDESAEQIASSYRIAASCLEPVLPAPEVTLTTAPRGSRRGAKAWQRKKSAFRVPRHDPLSIVLGDGLERGEPDDPRGVDEVVARQPRGVEKTGAVGRIGLVADDRLGTRLRDGREPRLVAIGRRRSRRARARAVRSRGRFRWLRP